MSKSGLERAANAAQLANGIKNIVKGAISGGLHGAAIAAAKSFAPQLIKIVAIALIVLLLLPVIILSALQDIYNLNEREIKRLIKESLNVAVERDEDDDKKITITITTKSPEEIMNGQGYDDDHKNWARLLYNTTTNPQGLSESDPDYIGGSGIDYSGITFTNGSTTVVYFNQLDSAWANTLYGRAGTIGREGCGPTALAIVVSTLTGRTVNPVEVSNWSAANGHRCVGNGSYHSLIQEGAKHYGLNVEKLGRGGGGQPIVDALSSGKLIIAIMNPGHFTSSGHFIVLRGVTSDGKILVAAPASRSRSEQEWSLSTILNEARPDAGAGGPFWSIGN